MNSRQTSLLCGAAESPAHQTAAAAGNATNEAMTITLNIQKTTEWIVLEHMKSTLPRNLTLSYLNLQSQK